MVAAVNYWPLPFFCWIIQKLATVPAPPPVSNGISHSARCWPSPSQRAPAGHTSHYQRLSARNNTFKPFQLSGHGWRRRLWPGEAGARQSYMYIGGMVTKLSHESVMVISYPAAQHTPVHKLDIRLVMCDVIGEDIDNDEPYSRKSSQRRRNPTLYWGDKRSDRPGTEPHPLL